MSVRARLGLFVAGVALLAVPACSGPKIPAGNLKELQEKKRELKEAQRKAQEEAPAAEAPGAAPAAAPAEPAAAPVPRGMARLVLRTADGGARAIVLRQPLIGRYERIYLSTGAVKDRERLSPEFVFRDGLDLIVLKLKKLARVEWVPADPPTRTGVRLRFTFRSARRDPFELAGEDLIGADNPSPPFIEGIDAGGTAVRLPLYPPIEPGAYEPIVEVVLGPGIG